MILENLVNKFADNFAFLIQFFSAPKIVGSIVPSSHKLTNVITSWVDLPNAESAVEFGPGTGAFTNAIRKKLNPEATFIAIEINPKLVEILEQKYPEVTIYNDSVANTAEYLSLHGFSSTDCIISGLPWATFNEKLQDELLDVVIENLVDRGQFVTFAYLHSFCLPSNRKLRQKLHSRFSEVTHSKIVWKNFPPALVYQARK